MAEKNLVAKATKAASYNIVLQLTLRVLTFVLNAYILRHITKDLLGVINVRLMLLYTTVQFLSREPFRRSCLSDANNQNWPAIINVTWLCLPICVFIGAVMSFVWLFVLERPDPMVATGYTLGVHCVVISVIIEVLAEPLYVVSQAFHYIKFKIFFVGSGITLRCIIMAVLVACNPENAIWAYSVAQLISSAYYTVVLYAYFTFESRRLNRACEDETKDPSRECNDHALPFTSAVDIIPFIGYNGTQFDRNVAKLTWSFMKQTVAKQLLTEGERYIMTVFNTLSFAEQGVYDIVNNLGSLTARLVFQPIEESSYVFFAQVVQRDVPPSQQNVDSASLSVLTLRQLLKLLSHVGLVIFTFGQAYSTLLLHLYGGSALSNSLAPLLLRWHCAYIVLIAINGVTECFVFAAMSKKQLDQHNRRLALFSVLFLFVAYLLTTLSGAVGFILANCFNMIARIGYSIYFISTYYAKTRYRPLHGILPSVRVLVTAVFSYLVTTISEAVFCCYAGFFYLLLHAAIGALCLLVFLAAIYVEEKELIAFLKTCWRDGSFGKKSEKVQ
ncbi:man(5)GlcNAc(2)-PP-dolichol translocation protein RFT1 [Rhipicephalus microplus]|uniref:Protein RFT1 homolog n=1 Tax=Rhipicephalus microplus TaxID=6941 RepID=A0A6M2CQZ2_RHIMP